MMELVLAAIVVVGQGEGGGAYYDVPVEELVLAAGAVLPSFDGGTPPWDGWNAELERLPYAVLEGAGEVVYVSGDMAEERWPERPRPSLGHLFVRVEAARGLAGTLFLPKVQGAGFLRLDFTLPAERATSSEEDFRAAEILRYGRLARARLPGGAWFRHRLDELREHVGPVPALPEEDQPWTVPEESGDAAQALGLFSGNRALVENLQLERALPSSPPAEETVELASLEGITVREIEWTPLLAPGETALDPLAALIPADQHALFFPSFQGLVDVLDEAERLGDFGLAFFEGRAADAGTRERIARQLCLELDAVARALGPLAVASVAVTGSDPYLRTGSDLALLLAAKEPAALHAFVDMRLRESARTHGRPGPGVVDGSVAGLTTRSLVTPSRSLSSHLALVGDVVVVSSSPVQLVRIARTAAGEVPALAAADEYRFFRQRYALGGAGESALLVLSDAAIRRWCSPRWRIGASRRVRAAAALAEEHAVHVEELVGGVSAERELGADAGFPELGALRLTADGVLSPRYGSLDFLTPIAELDLERVTEREAELYRLWRQGYQQNWSGFFDPIAARLTVSPEKTAVDLTVRPLILGTDYAELREFTQGPGLPAGSGDPHPEALVQLVLALNPEWHALKSAGLTLSSMASQLGADPLSWLGGWLTLYLDDGPVWEDVLAAEDLEEAFENLRVDLNDVPLAVEIGVASPLKLALFLSSLRAFVDGTVPGLTQWQERVEGERRFVEIGSSGLGDDFSLFYATAPDALILALDEKTLLDALARLEGRRSGAVAAPAEPWLGSHAALELRGRGAQLLDFLLAEGLMDELRAASLRNLPILGEWKRLFPDRDPVDVHRRVFRERLECPGGGEYAWNEAWQAMESTVFGCPAAPQEGPRRPPAWAGLRRLGLGLSFEDDGLRARAELEWE